MHSTDLAQPAADAQLRAHRSGRRELRPGLSLHCEDGCDCGDLTAQAEIAAGLRLVVLLEGQVDVSYGLTRVALSHAGAGARAALVSVAEPEQFVRRARAGVYSRRISLGLAPGWLAQAGGGAQAGGTELEGFIQHHLATRCWQLSPRAAAIAEQMVHPPPLAPLLQHMYLESHALDLVGEALASLCQTEPVASNTALLPREHQRLRELQAFLASGQADDLSLDAIARHAGINANTLQRQFRAVYGTTVFEQLRELRLQRARQALERDGLTVGQAALLAGYTSAANFATAYRRRFGLAPKLARGRV
ncbi:helix-turn-helix transcriptional regulator [Comamonas sp. J-3]|uniref:helix-turn-helix transcriptional regulator n=1 Tax=Comamonas trifloxystrobinivorans TaxID=3350256 RepID=UPI00372CA841